MRDPGRLINDQVSDLHRHSDVLVGRHRLSFRHASGTSVDRSGGVRGQPLSRDFSSCLPCSAPLRLSAWALVNS